ncbi:hypothetical protein BH20CHL8_BH20CHL8_00220 [soil metagenome]
MVRGADGSINRDETGRAPGRGTYVCHEPACQDPQRISVAVKRALGAEPGSANDLEVNTSAPT